MKNEKVKELRQMSPKALIVEKNKKQEQIVAEKASLVQGGKKNSNQIRSFKKEIAVIETLLNEKLLQSVQEGKNGQN